jgi:pectate lyase
VVFRTGGTIKLLSQIEISNPYITVAGQTAPGGGITVRNDPSNLRTPIRILTHDVIIRYIRSRPGPSTELSGSLDAFDIDSGYNIIIDHSSFSWATDEVLSLGTSGSLPRARDVTIQWSIIAEGLSYSTHEKGGEHSKGSLISAGTNNISLHHNLYAQNVERNPRIQTNGLVDIVNNVIYNPGFSGGWGPSHSDVSKTTGESKINYVGNYYKPGVNSGAASYYVSTGGPANIFLQDNLVPHDVIRPSDTGWVVGTRHLAATLATTSPQDAYQQVLDKVGAIYPVRDAVDQRINDVKNGTGKIIDDPSQVGGWPNIAAGTPPLDSDYDGMPDDWERLHGLNPMNSADGSQDANADGYTNVEEYLNTTGD